MDPQRFAEDWLAEDAPLIAARQRAAEVGVSPVSSGTGAALRLLAATIGARAIVETGTGTGVSGLWLLRGMAEDGILTSIDTEGEHQRLARAAFQEAGVAAGRTRLITGAALDVLPRLTDAAYDLVHLDAGATDAADCLAEAVRLLRPRGILAIPGALSHGRVPDPAARDPETVALRSLGAAVREDHRLVPALLPVGDGLLVACRLTDPAL